MLSEALHCRPKTFRRYVDDSYARFIDADHAGKFLCVLNSQDDKIQYTIDKENPEGVLAFLDISIRNKKSGRYEFSIHRKDAIANLQIHRIQC